MENRATKKKENTKKKGLCWNVRYSRWIFISLTGVCAHLPFHLKRVTLLSQYDTHLRKKQTGKHLCKNTFVLSYSFLLLFEIGFHLQLTWFNVDFLLWIHSFLGRNSFIDASDVVSSNVVYCKIHSKRVKMLNTLFLCSL